ncbi:molybdopterin oxidoreductase family protein [Paenibacillus macerans]|uniref:molybdopterin oxidoreductase family protein n=1 Tax=Paenibacillus macerans TaxID=44252 RepID=UPI00203C3F6D|nr:molybdopterin oxidoreductase family protein [Paenibacillus macerans]MCM3703618.1 molybdopterin oxidoreductase family protein [Paenibacillus macerans]
MQEQHGPDSIAVFGGGSLTNEVCYLLGKFTRVALRSRYVDYNGRYCMSSAAAAQQKAFGIDRGLSFPLDDIPKAKYIILAGTNIAECQPTMMPYLLAAKKQGAVLVTIDPRQTLTSKIADLHITLQPGHDSLLISGMLYVLLEENLYDAEFVSAHTEGLQEVREAVRLFPPDRVAALTGVAEDTIRTVARGFAAAETAIVLTARGLEQQVNGVEHTLQYINLCLLAGHIGKPGSGFGSVTGQANGQGGREHGLKADQLPGYRSLEDAEARAHVARVWGIEPADLPGKGVSAYELFGKILDGSIKAMIILGSNPLVSSPNNARVAKALAQLELLVVVDLFETETAAYADWLLPGTSFLEAEGTLTNLEGRVFHRPQAFAPAGDSLPDYRFICALAERLGRGQYFRYTSVSDVFDELCRASAGGNADYSGMSYSRLKEAQGLFWPCPAGGEEEAAKSAGQSGERGSGGASGTAGRPAPGDGGGHSAGPAAGLGAGPEPAAAPTTAVLRGQGHPGTPRLFADGVFPRAGGPARLHGITPQPPAESADPDYPYLLTTGRLAGHYLSGAQTRRTEALAKKAPEPVAELHPALAEQLRLRQGEHVRLTTRRGSLEFAAKLAPDIHPRTIFVPFHWGGELAVNRLTNDALHPISRMPEFKICAVRVERVEPVHASSVPETAQEHCPK